MNEMNTKILCGYDNQCSKRREQKNIRIKIPSQNY